jgi:hypothetical protein
MSYPFRATTAFVARFAGAAIADQVGFPGSKTPDYVGVGYSLLASMH